MNGPQLLGEVGEVVGTGGASIVAASCAWAKVTLKSPLGENQGNFSSLGLYGAYLAPQTRVLSKYQLHFSARYKFLRQGYPNSGRAVLIHLADKYAYSADTKEPGPSSMW